MSKQILIDSFFGLVRTAIAEGSALVDYYEEPPDQGRSKGNIYRGVVKKVDAPIQAAFVRFTGGRDGFLPLRDAASGGRAPKVGDSVLVQVVKDEVGDKGAALTTKLSLSGRYLVFIPARESEGGISSRITDEDRAALKKALGELLIPEGGSVILRTAALNKGPEELQADLDRLLESYREITARFAEGGEPALLFREVPPALRYLREYYTPDVERIWVNQEEVLNQCRQFFHLYEPKSAAKVVLSQDGPLLFQKLGLDAEVERLNSRKVSLPSGANIVIDQAEALVAIDVNSAKAGGRGERGERGENGRGRHEAEGGTESARRESEALRADAGPGGEAPGGEGEAEGMAKARGKGRAQGRGGKGRSAAGAGLEETVFSVNREAAGEIARQLRLRDLGGIIIVDFIDMEEDKHRRQIEEIMRKALAGDKAKVKVYDISPLGIMQISRQRLRKAGTNFSHQGCDACHGRGWHPSPAVGAIAALRKLEERLHGKKAGQSLTLSAPYPVANKLLNEFREHVLSMERRYGCTLRVTALPAVSGDAAIVSHAPAGEDGKAREAAGAAPRDPARARGPIQGRGPGSSKGEGRARPQAQARNPDPRRAQAPGPDQAIAAVPEESRRPEAAEPISLGAADGGIAADAQPGAETPSERAAVPPGSGAPSRRGRGRRGGRGGGAGSRGGQTDPVASAGPGRTRQPEANPRRKPAVPPVAPLKTPPAKAAPAPRRAPAAEGQADSVSKGPEGDSGAPAHRRRRRSRRGKGGSKDGAPAASPGIRPRENG